MCISAIPIEVCGAASKDVHSSIGRGARTDTAMDRGNARCQAAITVLYSRPQTAICGLVATMRLECNVAHRCGGARRVATASCAGVPPRSKGGECMPALAISHVPSCVGDMEKSLDF